MDADEGVQNMIEASRQTASGETLYFSFHEPIPVIYTFVPQSDITAFELARCVLIMKYGTAYEEHVMELPAFVRRHFVKRGQ